jgi:membrane protease YdiL (CAAX protease family)
MAFGAQPHAAAICTAGITPAQARTISYLGAGLYEESLFRLLLLPVLYGLARSLGMVRAFAGLLAIAVSSLIFAAAHYLPPESNALSPAAYVAAIETVHGNAALWYGFVFRAMAGVAFGTLFVLRGFGVTVGSHALYDILVGFMATLTA